jgi:hypothetical protein
MEYHIQLVYLTLSGKYWFTSKQLSHHTAYSPDVYLLAIIGGAVSVNI